MQNQYFNTYPLANQYTCYNGGVATGFPMGNYYGYWPWGLHSSNLTPTTAIKNNGLNTNFNQYGGHFGYPQYSNPILYNSWANYPYSGWFNAGQTYPQIAPWQRYYPYWMNQWNLATGHNGTYYSWPTMSYLQNQIQYPNYAWPPPVYWGVQQSYPYKPDAQPEDGTDRPKQSRDQGCELKNTSSNIINAFHVPSIIARKTVSDIPRTKEYTISLKKSETSTVKGESEDGLPFLLKISDTSIQQIAPSRSFGPSMVYNTESDPNNRPPSSQW